MMTNSDNWQLIGSFLRQKREMIDPELVGIVRSSRSRTPGLRREDVAALAQISTVWYSKIERGKAKGVSKSVLKTLADVLKLNLQEFEYLLSLSEDSESIALEPCRILSEQSQLLLEQVNPLPALMMNDYFDILGVNQAFTLFCGINLNELALDERNYIYLAITNAKWQQFLPADDEPALVEHLERMAGLMRSRWMNRRNDPIFNKRIETFKQCSAIFAKAWDTQKVQSFDHLDYQRRHAHLGLMALTKQVWWNHSELASARFNVFYPQTSDDMQRLTTLFHSHIEE
ncbi:helix-turn-helix domain-containing protein [Celerinatantimonas sp. MCCC 1A17872]|uniref:helix-turn-helix domain-containing protein n=1 Tax=Celerinatantimonas sp. MCCC 1A17872 TaxID=3177514 RepID=UPI0038C16526